MPTSLERVEAALEFATGYRPPGPGNWICPAHPDKRPSLSLFQGDKRVVLTCRAGCEEDEVLRQLGIAKGDLFEHSSNGVSKNETAGEWTPKGTAVAIYDYVDESGQLLFQSTRTADKGFSQRQPDATKKRGWRWDIQGVRRVLYRLPRVMEAAKAGATVWIAEGEKDVHALEAVSAVATCNPMGAGKWHEDYADALSGVSSVVVVRDKDGAGIKHAADVEASLLRRGIKVRVVEAKTGKDAADHLGAGHGLEDFVQADTEALPAGELVEESTWVPVDMATLRQQGISDQPPPTILSRTDGLALVYPGKIHSFNGESESGKSWGACLAALQQIQAGLLVLFLDFEDDASTVVGRMLALGATWPQLETHFVYVRPDEPVTDQALIRLLELNPTLVVIDGVTEAMVLHDWDPLANRDSARFIARLARPFSRNGAAVVQVDHVTKNPEQRGKYAIGAQHKRAAVTGAMFTFTVLKPIGRGLSGSIAIAVEKDKPGHVRRAAASGRIGVISLTSDADGAVVSAELHPPGEASARPFRPTVLMERVSRRLEDAGEVGLTKNGIKAGVKGNSETLVLAAELLVAEKFVEIRPLGQSQYHVSVRPYRRDEDPRDPETEAARPSPDEGAG